MVGLVGGFAGFILAQIRQSYAAGKRKGEQEKAMNGLSRRVEDIEEEGAREFPRIDVLNTQLQVLVNEVGNVNRNVDRLTDLQKETHKYTKRAMEYILDAEEEKRR